MKIENKKALRNTKDFDSKLLLEVVKTTIVFVSLRRLACVMEYNNEAEGADNAQSKEQVHYNIKHLIYNIVKHHILPLQKLHTRKNHPLGWFFIREELILPHRDLRINLLHEVEDN